MYKWEVHTHADEEGYAPIIGFVETSQPDYGDATELAKYYAQAGEFDTKHSEYDASDVSYVTPSRY